MTSATLLAFDYGEKRIGVAVGQTISASAHGVETILNYRGTPDWQKIDKLIAAWEPASLVVGLPISMDGEETDMSKRARVFAKTLQQKYQLSVVLHDERLSSNEADVVIKNELDERTRTSGRKAKGLKKKRLQTRDQVAAALILQSYFSNAQ